VAKAVRIPPASPRLRMWIAGGHSPARLPNDSGAAQAETTALLSDQGRSPAGRFPVWDPRPNTYASGGSLRSRLAPGGQAGEKAAQLSRPERWTPTSLGLRNSKPGGGPISPPPHHDNLFH